MKPQQQKIIIRKRHSRNETHVEQIQLHTHIETHFDINNNTKTHTIKPHYAKMEYKKTCGKMFYSIIFEITCQKTELKNQNSLLIQI